MIGPVEMGALLKKIRLSKNLTLKELASDYLSVSFLSKFDHSRFRFRDRNGLQPLFRERQQWNQKQ